MKSIAIYLSILFCVTTLQSVWGAERSFLIVVREVEGSIPNGDPQKDAEQEATETKKFRQIIEVLAVDGNDFYARSSKKDSQVVFTGKLTSLPERRVKIEYNLHYSILGLDPPEALRIEGSMETKIGNQTAPPVPEDSISLMHPEGEPTYWELEVHAFYKLQGMLDHPIPPLHLRLIDESGDPVQGAHMKLFLGGDPDNTASENTSSDEDGILVMLNRDYLPLAKLIVEHEERDLVGSAHLERHLDTSREHPYVITMKKRDQEDEQK